MSAYDEYPLLSRGKLAKTLNGPGALPDAEVRALAALLAKWTDSRTPTLENRG